jgi:hypothetical protein
MDDAALADAIAAIDAANSDDPNTIVVAGATRPKELAHAELATAWVRRLQPDADAALLLAARAHHVRRWTIPRASQPSGRPGYLRWRRALYEFHASEVERLLGPLGCDPAVMARVQGLVAKRVPRTDPDAQALEDALCLVFVETQLHDVHARLGTEHVTSVVAKTLKKMSPDAIALAATIPLAPADTEVLRMAAAPPP